MEKLVVTKTGSKKVQITTADREQITIDEQKHQDNLNDYRRLRAKEYPNMGDQLDAIWKELNYRRMQGEELTQDADDMLGQVLATKKKYPKPEEKE